MKNTGVAGVTIFEGQIFMTEEELRPFFCRRSRYFVKRSNSGYTHFK